MASKRKKVVMTMDKKLEALQRIDKGECLKKIAEEYGVGTSTVSDWKKNRIKIEEFCFKMISKDSLEGRGTIKKAKHEQLDDALFVWFSEQRDRGVPLSGPILQEKALSLNKMIPNGDPTFTASQGWLDRWKHRHGIRQLTITGESLSSDVVASEKYKIVFSNLIASEGLSPDQIYNADETGLFYRMLPSKTLASKLDEAAPGYKKNKDRVTVMACSNASGKHKLPLVLIGKSKNPRALKNINHSSLPVVYQSKKSAWMDSVIFKRWFFDNFVPSVKKYLQENNLPIKAVLLIDNAPSHPSAEELTSGEITVQFLPPNVTPLLQPMDQGVLESMKKVYRRQLLRTLLEKEGEESVIQLLKSINVKHVIYMVASAWEKVTEVALIKSWKKLWPSIQDYLDSVSTTEDVGLSDECDSEEILHIVQQIDGCSDVDLNDVNDWLQADNNIGLLTDQEIVSIACSSATTHDSNDESENEEGHSQQEEVMTHAEAMEQLDRVMVYFERQPETTSAEMMALKRLRDRAARKRCTKATQKKLTAYFTTK